MDTVDDPWTVRSTESIENELLRLEKADFTSRLPPPAFRMGTATQVTVVLQNVPSSLAKVGDKLRSAEVNIDAISCTQGGDKTSVHLIVNDPDTAAIVLKDLGSVNTAEVLALRTKNRPGAIADIGRTCAAAGINIGMIYATTCGKEAMVYVTVENDINQAVKAFREWNKRTGGVS